MWKLKQTEAMAFYVSLFLSPLLLRGTAIEFGLVVLSLAGPTRDT